MAKNRDVIIVGAGPAGMTLANLLLREGIDCMVLEARSRTQVRARARAALVDCGVAELLASHGLAGRMRDNGIRHDTCEFRYHGRQIIIPYGRLGGGGGHWVYPQQELVEDLTAEYVGKGGVLHYNCPVRRIGSPEKGQCVVHCEPEPSGPDVLSCELVVGADGARGVSRASIPSGAVEVISRQHEFSWLAVLAQVPPSTGRIIYALHDEGFAGHMLRTPGISRFYLQCPVGEAPSAWPEDRIWDTLTRRLTVDGWRLTTGPVIQTEVVEMRTSVLDPMQYGNLFLLGDAAHVISPVGAKGMNLAIAEAFELAPRIAAYYRHGDREGLEGFSAACRSRIWRAQEFSHWLMQLLHSRPAHEDSYFKRLRIVRFNSLARFSDVAVTFSRGYSEGSGAGTA